MVGERFPLTVDCEIFQASPTESEWAWCEVDFYFTQLSLGYGYFKSYLHLMGMPRIPFLCDILMHFVHFPNSPTTFRHMRDPRGRRAQMRKIGLSNPSAAGTVYCVLASSKE